jgi:hypothetical protein
MVGAIGDVHYFGQCLVVVEQDDEEEVVWFQPVRRKPRLAAFCGNELFDTSDPFADSGDICGK